MISTTHHSAWPLIIIRLILTEAEKIYTSQSYISLRSAGSLLKYVSNLISSHRIFRNNDSKCIVSYNNNVDMVVSEPYKIFGVCPQLVFPGFAIVPKVPTFKNNKIIAVIFGDLMSPICRISRSLQSK